MDQKSFKKLSKEIFLDYGFVIRGKAYVMELPDITLIVNYRICRGIRSFDYYYFINALHDKTVSFDNRYDSAVEIHMEHDPTLKGYHAYHLAFEEYTEDDYRQLLTGMLHAYFDPYRENAVQHLKENALRLGLREKGQKYLGIYEDVQKQVEANREELRHEAKERIDRIRTEARPEEHIPLIKVEGNTVTISVSSEPHPMEEKHRISAIGLQTDKKFYSVRLAAGEQPVASFTLVCGETPVEATAFCTTHGIWKANA